jgi:hypothetical protein
VALQPDQTRTRDTGERLRDLGLANAGLTLEQQRLLQRRGQVDGSGEAPVGEVLLARQRFLDCCGSFDTQMLTAS